MAKKNAILVNGVTQTATNNTATADISTIFGRAWVAQISCGTVTGTSPTLDVTIQQSLDGTNWSTLIAFTQITSSNAVELKYAASSADYAKPLLNYVRCAITVGGTDTPTFNTVTVRLLIDTNS